MDRLLGRYSAHLYALVRIIAGAMYMMHGIQKHLGIPGGSPRVPLASMAGAGGIVEMVCGLLIVLGLFTGIAAFIASGEMAVAYFLVHFPRGFWPIVNRGELAVLFCFLFLYFASQGSGAWSLDSLLGRVKRRA